MDESTNVSPEASRIFVLIGIALFMVALSIINFILLSRVIKHSNKKRVAFYLSVLQPSLNGLLFHDGDIPPASYWFNLDSIKNIINESALAKQALINHIVALKKSISGGAARILEDIYHDLDLDRHSIRKLTSRTWSRRAQGIRELSELNNNDSLRHISKLSATKNKTLREELLLSTIRLDKTEPLGFLDRWDGEITPWMRIHIHHYLSQLDIRAMPDFSKWFSSNREDVVIFAISMARQFRQVNTAPSLAKLLAHETHTIVFAAIRALAEMEAFAFTDDVASLAGRYWDNEKVSQAIVTCVGRIGQSQEHLELLGRYLTHPAFSVRLETVDALMRLGNQGHMILAQHETVGDRNLRSLIAHASEPLLR